MNESNPSNFPRPPCNSDEQEIITVTKTILANRLFLGCYQERRYVGVLGEYRDVVVISEAESQLKNDILHIQKILSRFYGVKWVGMTKPGFPGAPAGVCLWVKLANIPFGEYWFQVRQVKFENGEVLLRLKCIRPSHAEDKSSTNITASTTQGKSDDPKQLDKHSIEYSFDFDPGVFAQNLVKNIKETSIFLYTLLTRENLILSAKVFVATTIAVISVFFAFVKYIGEYFLKLLREISLIIQSSTPIGLRVIDLLTKTIGGLYLLIAMMWRGRGPLVPPPPGSGPGRQLALPPRHKISRPTFNPDWKARNKQLREDLRNF